MCFAQAYNPVMPFSVAAKYTLRQKKVGRKLPHLLINVSWPFSRHMKKLCLHPLVFPTLADIYKLPPACGRPGAIFAVF